MTPNQPPTLTHNGHTWHQTDSGIYRCVTCGSHCRNPQEVVLTCGERMPGRSRREAKVERREQRREEEAL